MARSDGSSPMTTGLGRSTVALGFMLALQLGCPAAPVEIDATAVLGEDQVKCRAVLRDMRVESGGLVNALSAFAQVAKPDWLSKEPCAPHWASYTWRESDGGVDLEMEGTLSRATFDKCTRDACRGGKSFPLKLCGDKYELVDAPTADLPGASRSWPADAGVLHYAGRNRDDALQGTVSAREAYGLYMKDPAAVLATAAWIESFDDAYESGSVAEARRLAEVSARQSTAHGERSLERAMEEAIRRARQRLLHAYLVRRGYAFGLQDAPASPGFHFVNKEDGLIPAQALPEAQALKLRVMYEVALNGYAKDGELTDVLPMLRDAGVCTDKRVLARAGYRRLCDLLTIGP